MIYLKILACLIILNIFKAFRVISKAYDLETKKEEMILFFITLVGLTFFQGVVLLLVKYFITSILLMK